MQRKQPNVSVGSLVLLVDSSILGWFIYNVLFPAQKVFHNGRMTRNGIKDIADRTRPHLMWISK